MPLIYYYSSATGNTHHFVEQLGCRTIRLNKGLPNDQVFEPFVLIVPTYAGAEGQGAVPKRIIQFLNEQQSRSHLLGVIAGGNRSFGWTYGLAGKIIAQKCSVPCLYRFELRGTNEDVRRVKNGLRYLWNRK
ncbi:class Ib ribonucleoside-diphosphate reductase assembly flavoprotein NrdI [Bartonella tamiae]|uniref:Protein NrdI n=1 Tax=Bartonella tamiae Th239 TaxID=1094558 RepID=J0ZPH4_9HYPH|nr:class Ib ribonucleoside-diphosphate reductase assembly flavoprotein NrdI [Bartonella tamiae]EJF90478.1 nrdI protein [Bartonella tamiae Th239]EJF93578.1 nrdI protein [Bartonella tamiae Th307]